MPSAALESPIREAFIYGQVSCHLSLTGRIRQENYRPGITEDEWRDIFQRAETFAKRRILDIVAPKLEQLVEESGAEVGMSVAARANMRRPVLNAFLAAQVDCEVMADVNQEEVAEVVEAELMEPLEAYTDGLEEEMEQSHESRSPAQSQAEEDHKVPFDALVSRVLDVLRGYYQR